jgi:hypothetical protein
MTRIAILAVAIALAVAILAYVCMQPAAADWCQGIVTSNGACIGSQGNVDPPIVQCDDQSSDSRCRRR